MKRIYEPTENGLLEVVYKKKLVFSAHMCAGDTLVVDFPDDDKVVYTGGSDEMRPVKPKSFLDRLLNK